MEVSASVSGEARGGTFVAAGCSSFGEAFFSAEAAMLGLASSGVCSLGMSGAVVFCRERTMNMVTETVGFIAVPILLQSVVLSIL